MKTQKEEFNFPEVQIEVTVFERILLELGITKVEYCRMRGVSGAWFYNVLRKRNYLTHKDIKAVLKSAESGVSIEEFEKVLGKYGVEVEEDS